MSLFQANFGKPPQVARVVLSWPRRVSRDWTVSNVQELSGESRAPLVGDDNALSLWSYIEYIGASIWTQTKDLPHAAPHFDSLPPLSSDSDVGDLPVDLVASSRDPSVFTASQVVLLCSGHAHCCAILLVRIAWCCFLNQSCQVLMWSSMFLIWLL